MYRGLKNGPVSWEVGASTEGMVMAPSRQREGPGEDVKSRAAPGAQVLGGVGGRGCCRGERGAGRAWLHAGHAQSSAVALGILRRGRLLTLGLRDALTVMDKTRVVGWEGQKMSQQGELMSLAGELSGAGCGGREGPSPSALQSWSFNPHSDLNKECNFRHEETGEMTCPRPQS